MAGKPQAIENQGIRHVFFVNSAGELIEAYGDHAEHRNVIDGDYEPFADVTISRVHPDPSNPFFTWYSVHAAHVGGDAIRTVRWWGRAFGAQADHWEGPWAT